MWIQCLDAKGFSFKSDFQLRKVKRKIEEKEVPQKLFLGQNNLYAAYDVPW